MRPIVTAFLLAGAAFPLQASGQATNAERMASIAVGCVRPHVGDFDVVRLDGPDRLPFLRSAVVAAWQAAGRTVYEADGSPAEPAADVRLAVEGAGVAYTRADHDELDRTVRLDLLVVVTAPDGVIVHDGACRETVTDRVGADGLDALENRAYDETVGERPGDGFLKRVLQPVVVTAATAVGVFLFFSLRSRRADDGG